MEQVNLHQGSIEALRDERHILSLQRRKLILRSIWLVTLLPGLIGVSFVGLRYYFIPAHSWIHQWDHWQFLLSLFLLGVASPKFDELSRISEQIRKIDWEIKDREGLRQVQEITAKIASGGLKPNPHLQ